MIADSYLLANYRAAGVRIVFEGEENLLDEPVIFAMNHTDRFNFWPFQYELLGTRRRHTATWVKGKNYDNAFVARFMELTNNIPVASRGYLIARDFVNTVGRAPSEAEYTELRAAMAGGPEPRFVPRAILHERRDVLGLSFDPRRDEYGSFMSELFRALMGRFVMLNERAGELGVDLLVFPQGGLSIRLSKGHVGIAQIALHLDRPIVPVACNHCDLLYPGDSPWARGGEVIYRFGKPMYPEEMRAIQGGEAFVPFDDAADNRHRAAFQRIVDVVMDRIDENLDERHRYTHDRVSDGVTGAERFVE